MIRSFFVFIILFMTINGLIAQEITPESILAKLDTVYSSINDYQCKVDEWCSNGQKYEKRLMYYFFKKPLMIRTDILEGNKAMDKGSVAVYTGGNKITGRKGGILSGIALDMDKNNPMVTTVRGLTIDDADLESIIKKLHFYLKNGDNSVKILENGTYKLTGKTGDPVKNGSLSSEEIILDPGTFLPIQADGYENDKLVQHSVWSEYFLNSGLPDELFRVNFNIKKLKEMGIATFK